MAHQKTILCVDDEKDVVDCLYDTFMETYNVKTALSGKEALEIFEQEEIALVITDQRMEGMEGVELLARIREKDPLCKKILLTGYADINAAVDSINKGSVDRYFNKPWDDEELVQAVNHLIKMYDFDRLMSRALSDRKGLVAELGAKKREVEAFVAFLDCQQQGICVLDGSSKILYVNLRGLEILGCKEVSAVTGKNYREVFPLSPEQEKALHKKARSGIPEPLPLSVGLENGSNVQVKATLCLAESEGRGLQVRGILFQ